jgi:hypothetical protein
VTRTSTDVADWLGRQGLARYAQAFADNEIGYAALPGLTEADLGDSESPWVTAERCSRRLKR